jgi:hypothetical protein
VRVRERERERVRERETRKGMEVKVPAFTTASMT